MFPIVVTKTLAASSANNICLSQTPTSGTALTLNGSAVTGGVAVLDTQRRVLVTFGNELSARTMVLTGTNEDGATITETLAIASGGGATVASQLDYKRITSLVPAGGGFSAAVTVGTNGVGATQWKFVDFQLSPAVLQLATQITSGSAGYEIDWTLDSPNAVGLLPAVAIPNAVALTLSGGNGTCNFPIVAWRLQINSGAGAVRAVGVAAGISQGG